jgi:hypothetical protein
VEPELGRADHGGLPAARPPLTGLRAGPHGQQRCPPPKMGQPRKWGQVLQLSIDSSAGGVQAMKTRPDPRLSFTLKLTAHIRHRLPTRHLECRCLESFY